MNLVFYALAGVFALRAAFYVGRKRGLDDAIEKLEKFIAERGTMAGKEIDDQT